MHIYIEAGIAIITEQTIPRINGDQTKCDLDNSHLSN